MAVCFPVKFQLTAVASAKSTTMDPECNRKFLPFLMLRNPDVQIQTVFSHARNKLRIVIELLMKSSHEWMLCLRQFLHAHITECICFISSFPWIHFHRCFPAQFSCRCFCIRNSFKYNVSILFYAFYCSFCRFHYTVHNFHILRTFIVVFSIVNFLFSIKMLQ